MRINERLQEAAQAIGELFADHRAEAAEHYQRLLAALQDSEDVSPSAIKGDSPATHAPQPAQERETDSRNERGQLPTQATQPEDEALKELVRGARVSPRCRWRLMKGWSDERF
jgi:hypothetical protein